MSTTSAYAVELRGVSKHFFQRQNGDNAWENLFHKQVKEIKALDAVDLALRPGEFVAYAGPNGAGKSTTFKLLCGMLAPEQGVVRTLGFDPIRQRIPLMKKLGVLFGNRTELWWDHPVATSFRWKKAVWDIPQAVYDKQFDFACELLDLKPFLHTFARELSLGQRMRADLGLLLLHNPSLILLDEPTLGLDVLAKRQMIDALKALNRDAGATILVTSHDLDDLTEMARRIVMLSSGKVVFDGTLPELRAVSGEARTVTLTLSGDRPLPEGLTFAASEGNRHTYTFDPHKLPVERVLSLVATLPGVLDVELGRAPIEQAIAALYKEWKQADAVAK